MLSVGFIGLGRMGTSICLKLLEKKHPLKVYNRTKKKAAMVLDKGAAWCDSSTELGIDCDIIFLCLSDEKATEEILTDEKNGILTNCSPGCVIIDTGTISPSSALNNNIASLAHNVHYVSCPVSGGIEGATKGTLAAIVASEQSLRAKIEPLINCFADKITWLTSHADAQKLKILNNLAESINLLGAFEVIDIGLKHGIPLNQLHSVFTSCRGRSAYMDVALNYLYSNKTPSDVSLSVRCKDLSLSNLLCQGSEIYTLSNTASKLFTKVLEKYGPESDQCEYSNFITSTGVN